MIASRGEQDIQFPHYLPVHLTYQTAFVDENGRLEFREDMYGRDQVLIAILQGEERKIAESPVERREGYSGRPAAVAGGYYQNGYSGLSERRQLLLAAVRRRLRRSAAGAAPARGARPSVVGFPIKNARE